ncbi:MAG: toll/interleukin-1 receptor domain-containing protein [Acidobacteriota bacterium]
MPHVFISHSGKDDEVVARIRRTLEGRGVTVWADSVRFAGGDKLEPEIKHSIETAGSFITVLSTNAVNSAWVAREIKHALKVQKKRGARGLECRRQGGAALHRAGAPRPGGGQR